MKFYKLEGNFLNILLPKLHELGFKQIENHSTGGDNDFIIVDSETKQYAYFENGYKPYYEELPFYNDKELKDLMSMRYN